MVSKYLNRKLELQNKNVYPIQSQFFARHPFLAQNVLGHSLHYEFLEIQKPQVLQSV